MSRENPMHCQFCSGTLTTYLPFNYSEFSDDFQPMEVWKLLARFVRVCKDVSGVIILH